MSKEQKIRCASNSTGYSFVFLLKRYAKGRKFCNCQEAYYAQRPGETLSGKAIIDYYCPGGCSANQIDAKYEVAKEALKEIRKLQRLLKKLENK